MKEKFKKAIKEYLVKKLPVNVMLNIDVKIGDIVDNIYDKVDEEIAKVQFYHWTKFEQTEEELNN